jgi:hypothetical protein
VVTGENSSAAVEIKKGPRSTCGGASGLRHGERAASATHPSRERRRSMGHPTVYWEECFTSSMVKLQCLNDLCKLFLPARSAPRMSCLLRR